MLKALYRKMSKAKDGLVDKKIRALVEERITRELTPILDRDDPKKACTMFFPSDIRYDKRMLDYVAELDNLTLLIQVLSQDKFRKIIRVSKTGIGSHIYEDPNYPEQRDMFAFMAESANNFMECYNVKV